MSADEQSNDLAQWLSVLGLAGLKPPVREAALAHIARIHMAQSIELAGLLGELGKARAEIIRLHALENSMRSVLQEFERPAAQVPSSPPRLSIVREGGE